MAETEHGTVDLDRLSAWLDQHAPEIGSGPLKTQVITGGSTNLILRLDRGGEVAILRSPPIAAPSPQGAKTIQREATLLAALDKSDVPHPAFHVYCEDTDVLGVPFYIMDNVDGWAANISTDNVVTYDEPFQSGPNYHHIGYAMIEGLAAMANCDWEGIGLTGFGKHEGFLERQPDRWLAQVQGFAQRYPKYTPRHQKSLNYIADWLRANTPSNSTPGLMHGDIAVNNVMFARRPPARIIAIVDWETATIGDPLLDLAAFSQGLLVNDGDSSNGMFDSTNWPRRGDALNYYADLTGRDLSAFDYYTILVKFRSSCMIEYKVAESIQGLSSPEKGARFDKIVTASIAMAEAECRRLG